MQITLLKLDQVHPDPDQPRKFFDEKSITELASSIMANGVMTPLEVRPNGAEGSYFITTGERRFRALSELKDRGMEIDVPVIIRESTGSDVLVRQVVENVQRQDMKPMEEAHAYGVLRSQGCNQKEIASAVGKSTTHVGRRLAFLDLPEQAQTLIDNGGLTIEVATEMTKVKSREALVELIEEAAENQWEIDASDVGKILDDERKAANLAKVIKMAEAHGLVVYTRNEVWEMSNANRRDAEEALKPKEKGTYVALSIDHDRAIEPDTLGEAKLKRTDAGVVVIQAWSGEVTCFPVVKEKVEIVGRSASAPVPTKSNGQPISIPHDKRTAAVNKAQSAWVLEQDRLVVANRQPKAAVVDLMTAAFVGTARAEAIEQAVKILNVEVLTKPDPYNKDRTVKAYAETFRAELQAEGIRQLRALLALSMAALDTSYTQAGKETIEAFRAQHEFVPFDTKAFTKEWERTYLEREAKKRSKAEAEAKATTEDTHAEAHATVDDHDFGTDLDDEVN